MLHRTIQFLISLFPKEIFYFKTTHSSVFLDLWICWVNLLLSVKQNTPSQSLIWLKSTTQGSSPQLCKQMKLPGQRRHSSSLPLVYTSQFWQPQAASFTPLSSSTPIQGSILGPTLLRSSATSLLLRVEFNMIFLNGYINKIYIQHKPYLTSSTATWYWWYFSSI